MKLASIQPLMKQHLANGDKDRCRDGEDSFFFLSCCNMCACESTEPSRRVPSSRAPCLRQNGESFWHFSMSNQPSTALISTVKHENKRGSSPVVACTGIIIITCWHRAFQECRLPVLRPASESLCLQTRAMRSSLWREEKVDALELVQSEMTCWIVHFQPFIHAQFTRLWRSKG